VLFRSGTTRNPKGVVQIARESPLYDLNIDGASGCLIQVEGGPDMTLSHLNEVTDEFVSNLSPNCQVIMGARVGEGLIGKLRITAVVSGL
jgi:cell division protein FtsZ